MSFGASKKHFEYAMKHKLQLTKTSYKVCYGSRQCDQMLDYKVAQIYQKVALAVFR